jgi:acyl carrier protein
MSSKETKGSGDMLNLVKESSAQVLMIEASEIEDAHTLAHFGLDSQNAIEIINAIFSITKVRIPILLLLSGDYSVQELAGYLFDKLSSDNSKELLVDNSHGSKNRSLITTHLATFQHQKSFIEFSFSISANLRKPEIWKVVMQIFIRMNSTLRNAGDLPGQRNALNDLVDIEDFCLPFAHLRMQDLFNPETIEKDVPVSVVYQDGGNQVILRVFCNREHSDSFCGTIIEKDLQNISAYAVAGKTAPAWLDKLNIDYFSLHRKSIQIKDKSKDYWKKRLCLCRTSTSLKNIGPMLDFNEKINRISLPLANVSALEEFTLDNEWTMCIIMCSAFQLALHKMTNAERVPLLMEVDMRSNIQECEEQISPCANLIPVISPNFLRPAATIKDVLNENKMILKEANLHNLYSIADIMDLPEFDSKLHKTHSFLFQTITNTDHQYINLISTQTERDPSFETLFHVQYNETQKSMVMELHFCPKRVSTCTASILTDFIMKLIQNIPMNVTKILEQLQLKTTLQESLDSSPKGKKELLQYVVCVMEFEVFSWKITLKVTYYTKRIFSC